jgi:hypothetical protein
MDCRHGDILDLDSERQAVAQGATAQPERGGAM